MNLLFFLKLKLIYEKIFFIVNYLTINLNMFIFHAFLLYLSDFLFFLKYR
jgi:hypothetical protein